MASAPLKSGALGGSGYLPDGFSLDKVNAHPCAKLVALTLQE